MCSARLTSANCLESDSEDLFDEKKREAFVQGKFVVKMYWLKEQDLNDCRNGHLLVRQMRLDSRGGNGSQQKSKDKIFFHIFGNNLNIRPDRAIKIRDGGLGGDLRTKLTRRQRKTRRKKNNGSDFYSSPLTTSKQTKYIPYIHGVSQYCPGHNIGRLCFAMIVSNNRVRAQSKV